MKRVLMFMALTLFASHVAYAAVQILSISIDGTLLRFTVVADDTRVLPTCVSAEYTNTWSSSLESDLGQGIYASLIAAVSLDSEIEIEGAGVCANDDGVEQVKAIALAKKSGAG